jgi:hypothetical protein
LEILYCSVCGKMIPPGGIDEGKRYVKKGEPICPKCYRELPYEEHRGTTLVISEGIGETLASQEPEPDYSSPQRPSSRLSPVVARRRQPGSSSRSMPAATRRRQPDAGKRTTSSQRLHSVRAGVASPRGSAGVWLFGTAAVGLIATILVFSTMGGRELGSPEVRRPPAGRRQVAPPPSPAGGARGNPRGPAHSQAAQLYRAAESFRDRSPKDYEGALSRFEKARRAGEGTEWEAKATEAIEGIRRARSPAAEEAFSSLKKTAASLAAKGDYDSALVLLEKPAAEFAGLLKADLEAERRNLKEEAETRLRKVIAAAIRHAEEGRPGEGLEALASVDSVRYSPMKEKLAELRARLRKEKLNAPELARKRRAAEARKALEGLLTGYDELMLQGEWSVAAEHLAAGKKKLDAGVREMVSARLAPAEKVAALLAAWHAKRLSAVKGLVGSKVSLRTGQGGKVSGQVQAATAAGLKVSVRFRLGDTWGERVQAVKFTELAPGELDRLLPAFRADGPEGRMAEAVLALSLGDLSRAGKALQAAADHPLAGRWTKRLAALLESEKETAAKLAWEGSVKGLLRPKYDEAAGKAVLAALDAFMKAHGGTEFAEGRAAEVARIRSAARSDLIPRPGGPRAAGGALPRGCVGHWKLDRAKGGRVLDHSGRDHHGRIVGRVRIIPDGGRVGGAAVFGMRQQVTVPDFDYGSGGSFTVAFWFSSGRLSGRNFQYMFNHGTFKTAHSLNVYLSEDRSYCPGILRTALCDGNDAHDGEALDVSGSWSDGRWYHYALVVSASGSKVYIDGRQKATSAQGGDAFNPKAGLYLGGRADRNRDRYYAGKLDEVRIYNRALSAEEIRRLVQAAGE